MTNDRVSIVAEAAQGYEGDPTLARLLARAAAASSADLVKYQIVYADELAAPSYQHYALFQQLEMPDSAWRAAADEARKGGIGIAFDVYGDRSLSLALELEAAAVKIHATDFFNDTLVERALRLAPHVFLSAGGIDVTELRQFFERHRAAEEKITLFYGFQAEPTPTEHNNLARLRSIRAMFPRLTLGYMDHTDGGSEEAGWLSTLAIPLGVRAIEKHLTLDRALALEDYVSAVGPEAFRTFVGRVRMAEAALGGESLDLTTAERAYRRRAVKVVVARRPLRAGETIAPGDVSLLRTALTEGSDPFNRLTDVVGHTLARDVASGDAVYRETLR